ncbi:MAG TPA: PAS domain S-box protein [Solirubrobacteraceae bacterium]|nr:PAS domain S-box protein [Solirubrobacteraceae bacterium]
MSKSWYRPLVSVRVAALVLVGLLSVGGYVITSRTIQNDLNADSVRRADVEGIRLMALLERARASVAGLGTVLGDEPIASQRRFSRLVGSTSGSIGLVDALWIQSAAGTGRPTAVFTTGTRPALRPGLDVRGSPSLAAAIQGASTSGVVASGPATLGAQRGFYLVQRARFGRGARNPGYLAVFVPRGWFTQSLAEDPRQVAFAFGDGQRLEGRLPGAPAATATVAALRRRWRAEVATTSKSGLQSLLPWLAFAWPIAAALLVFLVGNAVVRRRRAEREAERIFDFSLDMMGTVGLDGYFKRVNPAFGRVLGYPREQLLAQPLLDFVHPDDAPSMRELLDALGRGTDVNRFENRFISRDGGIRWLEWNVRPVPAEGVVYAGARDVTDRRRAERQAERALRMLEGSRDELRVLADEQAALRRVATLVARGVTPSEIFGAVVAEMRSLLDADVTVLERHEPDGSTTTLAAEQADGLDLTLRPGQLDQLGLGAVLSAPIVVEGRPWGSIGAAWKQPPDATGLEGRITQFTELVATAIANAESRAELVASRARVVAAGDEARRRIERDLHDGTQQRLVSLALALRAVETRVPDELAELKVELAETASGLAGALEDLQEISRGIHPAILSSGGLEVALRALARRAGLPVDLDVRAPGQLPQSVEVAIYYVVSEALTNAAKHGHATGARVELRVENALVRLTIVDDGSGGADPSRGSGLIGLRDRIEALGGTIEITSERGAGTTLEIVIPVAE